MAATMYSSLADLRSGSFNWKIKVRIIRQWRGMSKNGDSWKGVNLLLLDDQNTRMHAFVPGNVIGEHEAKLTVGNMCSMLNFSVKDYSTTNKFRCINHDKKIICTTYTEILLLRTDDHLIQTNMFDFYDFAGLEKMANTNLFLTDVIGVIENDTPIADLVNRYGKKQKQIKFNIVDGRASVNVCFWDLLAEEFSAALENVKEHPTIVIIASAKVSSWQPATQSTKLYELSNIASTAFYINYKHENVSIMGKMLNKASFTKYNFACHVKPIVETLPVASILQLSEGYIEKEVVCSINIKSVEETHACFHYYCTSCYKIIEMRGSETKCHRCLDRVVPEPELKWYVDIIGADETGTITISLLDREVRSMIGLNVEDFEEEVLVHKKFPPILKSIEGCHFWVKIKVLASNIKGELQTYYATNAYTDDAITNKALENYSTPKNYGAASTTQVSGPSIHIDDFSEKIQAGRRSVRNKKKIVSKGE